MFRILCMMLILQSVFTNGLSDNNLTTSKTSDRLDYEHLLNEKLLTAYKKTIRPGILRDGIKAPLKVTTQFGITRIAGFDDSQEIMSAQIYLLQYWMDQRLVWDPKDYGNITLITFYASDIWTPRVYLPTLDSFNQEDTTFKAKVIASPAVDESGWPAANLTLVTYAMVHERCAFDMTYFPFDNQQCSISVFGETYLVGEAYFETLDPIDIKVTFENGGEWNLIKLSKGPEPEWKEEHACLVITLQRRSLYYVVNLFLPTIIICLLNTIGLFASIETESDVMEFSNLGQTTLLSLGVLMLTVADQTPKGSGQISLLGIFFLAMICQTLLAALTASRFEEVHAQGGEIAHSPMAQSTDCHDQVG